MLCINNAIMEERFPEKKLMACTSLSSIFCYPIIPHLPPQQLCPSYALPLHTTLWSLASHIIFSRSVSLPFKTILLKNHRDFIDHSKFADLKMYSSPHCTFRPSLSRLFFILSLLPSSFSSHHLLEVK